MKTVELLIPLRVETNHYLAGRKLTLEDQHANRLIERKHARQVQFDAGKKLDPAVPRPFLPVETATANPAPKKAARLTGKAD